MHKALRDLVASVAHPAAVEHAALLVVVAVKGRRGQMVTLVHGVFQAPVVRSGASDLQGDRGRRAAVDRLDLLARMVNGVPVAVMVFRVCQVFMQVRDHVVQWVHGEGPGCVVFVDLAVTVVAVVTLGPVDRGVCEDRGVVVATGVVWALGLIAGCWRCVWGVMMGHGATPVHGGPMVTRTTMRAIGKPRLICTLA